MTLSIVDGQVVAPEGAVYLAFYNAERSNWSSCVYRSPACSGARGDTHGSTVVKDASGQWPAVFLREGGRYRVVAHGSDGAALIEAFINT